jgi:hypothetical protein
MDWAPLLRAGPVALAAAGEVARWARYGANLVDQIAQPPGGIRKLAVPVLAGASRWLTALSDTALPGDELLVGEAPDREMLRAFPAAFPRDPVPVIDGESDERLCAGISVSAARLRAASFTISRLSGTSPVLTGPSWMQSARAAAIVSDLGRKLTGALAERALALGQPPETAAGLAGRGSGLHGGERLLAAGGMDVADRLHRRAVPLVPGRDRSEQHRAPARAPRPL